MDMLVLFDLQVIRDGVLVPQTDSTVPLRTGTAVHARMISYLCSSIETLLFFIVSYYGVDFRQVRKLM